MVAPDLQTEVLVVGAGPVGLALAGDLGWRGRGCLLVERGDGTITQPKMDLVGIRTMEFCRRWGIVGEVEASPYDRDYPQDNVYLTSLNGFELGREAMPSMRAERPPPESPQKRERCPQNMFDPILRHFAESQAGTRILYRHEFKGFEQDGDGVSARIDDLAGGRELVVRAKYLVGCDGGRSRVREQLGIGMQGRGLLTYTTNMVFRCPDFNRLHDKKPGYRYMFVGPAGVWATIVAINGRDQWRMSIIGDTQERRYSEAELRQFAYRALGRPCDMEILSILPWVRLELVADRYHQGRIFICGDACHLTSPTGALGMNTGIGDAVDLSWKLAAVLEGWGGPRLLESYVAERRPIAHRITRFSTGNLSTIVSAHSSERLFDDSTAGREVRRKVGKALSEGLKREWYSLNMHLGNRYVGSPICVFAEDGADARSAAEDTEAIRYRPSSRPGGRAPHAWLADGRSTLDLFGRGFVLLVLGRPDGEERRLESAARRARVPLRTTTIEAPDVRRLYERRCVLVRPDGHVAWRGDAIPREADALLATICGQVATTSDEPRRQ